MATHKFQFEIDSANPGGLKFSGGPDTADPSEWKYFTHDEITFVSPSGPFVLELMLTHNPTGEVLPVPGVTPFDNNQSRFESGQNPENNLWKAGPVTVRTPQDAGIEPSGDPSGFVARYRYAVAVDTESGFILDTSQFGEWDHC